MKSLLRPRLASSKSKLKTLSKIVNEKDGVTKQCGKVDGACFVGDTLIAVAGGVAMEAYAANGPLYRELVDRGDLDEAAADDARVPGLLLIGLPILAGVSLARLVSMKEHEEETEADELYVMPSFGLAS